MESQYSVHGISVFCTWNFSILYICGDYWMINHCSMAGATGIHGERMGTHGVHVGDGGGEGDEDIHVGRTMSQGLERRHIKLVPTEDL